MIIGAVTSLYRLSVPDGKDARCDSIKWVVQLRSTATSAAEPSSAKPQHRNKPSDVARCLIHPHCRRFASIWPDSCTRCAPTRGDVRPCRYKWSSRIPCRGCTRCPRSRRDAVHARASRPINLGDSRGSLRSDRLSSVHGHSSHNPARQVSSRIQHSYQPNAVHRAKKPIWRGRRT